ncbi:MAG: hypothetical protein O3B72_10145, partial [Proteobacteria bacterium]|nr:hypothetical protein [Pseudomonadota bacterium]
MKLAALTLLLLTASVWAQSSNIVLIVAKTDFLFGFFQYVDYSRHMEITQATDALSALAQESRLAAFRLLVKAGREGLPAG